MLAKHAIRISFIIFAVASLLAGDEAYENGFNEIRRFAFVLVTAPPLYRFRHVPAVIGLTATALLAKPLFTSTAFKYDKYVLACACLCIVAEVFFICVLHQWKIWLGVI